MSKTNEGKGSNRHAGKFVGGYLDEKHIATIEEIEKLYDEILEPGRNRSRAMRYIIEVFGEHFTPDMIRQRFPKSQPSVGVNAQAVMNN